MKNFILFCYLFCSGFILSSIEIADGNHVIEGKWKVLKNIKINELTIRHLRQVKGEKSDICVSGHLDVIDLVGPINQDTADIMERILSTPSNRCRIKGEPPSYSECKEAGYSGNFCERITKGPNVEFPIEVYMSSGGGLLKSGFELGKILNKYNTGTIIPWHSTCASSCATAFLGGNFRAMSPDSSILFHAPYNYGKGKSSKDNKIVCQTKNPELEKYMIDVLGLKDGKKVYERTMDYCDSRGGWELNPDAALMYNITMKTLN